MYGVDLGRSDLITTRRVFLGLSAAGVLPGAAAGPASIGEPHFPSRLHLFVWRNWEISPTARMARLLGTTEREVLFPFVAALVPEVDVRGGRIVIDDRPGLLEAE